MKRFLTILALLLLAAGFRAECFAVDAFDASDAERFDTAGADTFAAAETGEETIAAEAPAETDAPTAVFLFTHSVKTVAENFLRHELGVKRVHGQPLPGILISLLIGAAFGLARKVRGLHRGAPENEQTAETALLTARLLRMNILFLNPPDTIHTISPGPDLFCQRE
jgi:hypothetical protein